MNLVNKGKEEIKSLQLSQGKGGLILSGSIFLLRVKETFECVF